MKRNLFLPCRLRFCVTLFALCLSMSSFSRADAQAPTPRPTPIQDAWGFTFYPPTGAGRIVFPLLDGVELNETTNILTAHFGYRNIADGLVKFPVTADNNVFFGGSISPFVGQPTVFMPGTFHRVFSAQFDLNESPSYNWFLNDTLVKIGADSPPLARPLNWRGAWTSLLSYNRDDLVTVDGTAWLAKRANSNVLPTTGDDWMLLAEKGDKGDRGEKGDKGETGEQGVQGLKGDQGDKGDKGDAGATGPQGTQGLTGATGPQGIKGDKGDKGETGAQGMPGIQGVPGPPGLGSVFASTGALIFPRFGTLVVSDARVKSDSLVIPQYVGGGALNPFVLTVENGRFTVWGLSGKQLRYFVINPD